MTRPGPAPKGDRAALTVRPPRQHMNVYKAEATARGMSVGDYLALKLAQAHGLDDPAWLSQSRDQPPLVS